MNLNCPICQVNASGSDPMLEHLITEHNVSKRRARFLTKKLVEWTQKMREKLEWHPEAQKALRF